MSTSSAITVADEPAPVVKTPTAASGATSRDLEDLSLPFDDRLASHPVELTSHAEQVPGQPCGRPDCPICNPPAKPAAPPPAPWKPLYFDNDFSYKGKPNAPHFLGEELKDMPVTLFDGLGWLEGSTLSVGGELRHRYMDEDNRLRPNLPPPATPAAAFGQSGRSTYNLWRWRQYVDWKVRDEARIYVEMLDASIFDEELPVTAIDANRWNIQNAFFDLKVAERDEKPVYLRVGRQELLYGAPQGIIPGGQHVISPLDWANTRRNFEGFRLISKGSDWDFDFFAARPVNTAHPTGAAGNRPVASSVLKYDNQRDEADWSRWYYGVYTVFKGIKDQTIEPYYIWLQTDAGFEDPAWADGDRHTLGLRWTATKPITDELDKPWLVFASDIEGAYQFGNDNGLDVQAGFFTSKLGVTLSQVPWTPNLQFIYYWASGDKDPTDGTNNTYDMFVPLNHAWWGIIDNIGGQNINDVAIQASVKPHAKFTFLSAMHWFDLDTQNDKLYTVTGAPLPPTAGTFGTEVGEELDLIATYSYNPNFDVQVGYSWFWYGSNVTNRALANGQPRDDATQFYVQTSLRY